MAGETKAALLSRLVDDVVIDLGNGTIDEAKLRQVRLLWRMTPDRERDGLSYTLKDIEQLVRDLRAELNPNSGKVRRVPIEYVSPAEDC